MIKIASNNTNIQSCMVYFGTRGYVIV